MSIDCDADDLVRRQIEARMVELGVELRAVTELYISCRDELDKEGIVLLYMSIKNQLDDFSYQLDCERHDWVLGNNGIITRVCIKCGAGVFGIFAIGVEDGQQDG